MQEGHFKNPLCLGKLASGVVPAKTIVWVSRRFSGFYARERRSAIGRRLVGSGTRFIDQDFQQVLPDWVLPDQVLIDAFIHPVTQTLMR